LLPTLLLLACVLLLSLAVGAWARPAGGLQLARPVRLQAPRGRMASLAWPRLYVDSDGAATTLAHPPQRLASQALALEELLYDFTGDPCRIVAVSRYAYSRDYSNVFAQAERCKPAVSSDPEQIVRLSPGLLLVSSTARADYTSLVRSAGIDAVRMKTRYESLDEIAGEIRQAGYLTGEDASAAQAELRFQREIAAAEALPRRAGHPRILGISGTYVYGRRTLMDDIIVRLGGVNVAATAGVEDVHEASGESIVGWNPEWIIAGSAPGGEDDLLRRMLANPAIAATAAARNGHIVILPDNIFSTNSPYSAGLMTRMAELLSAGQEGSR
jgi:ABC-type Fe3+-hydroxamate transport system substrate-binding protein